MVHAVHVRASRPSATYQDPETFRLLSAEGRRHVLEALLWSTGHSVDLSGGAANVDVLLFQEEATETNRVYKEACY